MCGTYTPTHVISVSYGEAEIDLPEYYQKRQCNEFMKLGLQGHTFLVMPLPADVSVQTLQFSILSFLSSKFHYLRVPNLVL
jgi:hypothetical protein